MLLFAKDGYYRPVYRIMWDEFTFFNPSENLCSFSESVLCSSLKLHLSSVMCNSSHCVW